MVTAEKAGLTRSLLPAVVVTGGAEGIGRAIAERFALHGHNLFLVARRRDTLEQAARALRERHGVNCGFAAIDLAAAGGAHDLLDAVSREGYYTDVLVNCAASAAPGSFAENDLDRVRATLALNVSAVTDLVRAVLPGMLERRRGGVLSVASIAGLIPVPQAALYSATKAYMIALTRAIKAESAGTGVRIAVVVPGPIATKFMDRQLNADAATMRYVPMISAEAVGRVAHEGFMSGQTLITPGLLNSVYRIGIKAIPHAWLVRMLRPVLVASFAGRSSRPGG